MSLPLVDLLNSDQRAALKHLRKKIANREHMRRYRAEHDGKMLCGGVDLPIEAGPAAGEYPAVGTAATPATSAGGGSSTTRSTPPR